MCPPVRDILVIALSQLLLVVGSRASADVPDGFPFDLCSCVIEFDQAGPVVDGFGSGQGLGGLLELLGGSEAGALLDGAMVVAPAPLRRALLSNGVIGSGRNEDGDRFEWIAWVGPDDGDADSIHELIKSLGPVRGLDRMMIPGLGLAIAEVQGGLLLSSEPPGALRGEALDRMGLGVERPRREARAAFAVSAPLMVTMAHELPMGGASSIAANLVDGALRVEYRGRFVAGPVMPPRAQRALDIEVLERLPSKVIAAMVEHTDAGIIPGEGLISRLLPYLVEPEPSDELRTRRLVVISEDEVGGRSEGGLRLPAIAVAIEVDGPGATARRQDLQVLASLNNLRNRLGGHAGLQHLPKSDELPDAGTRTIYTEALLDSAFSGHPMAKYVSVNWCQTGGDRCWQLYATTPELAKTVAECLKSEAGVLECVTATHAGRLDATSAVRHVRSWGGMAGAFVGADRLTDFEASVEELARLLEGVDSLSWTISVPSANALDAVIVLQPLLDDGVDR